MRAEEAINKTLTMFSDCKSSATEPDEAWHMFEKTYQQAHYSMSLYLYELNHDSEVDPQALYEIKHDLIYATLLLARYAANLVDIVSSEDDIDNAFMTACKAREQYGKRKEQQEYAQELTADILRKLFGISEGEDD